MNKDEKINRIKEFRYEIMHQCETKEQAANISKRLNEFCSKNDVDESTCLIALDGAGECLYMKMAE
jgi:hypothetical protein